MFDQPLLALTIGAFCKSHSISRSTFYNLSAVGQAPRTFRVGRKVLISSQAAAEWRQAMERSALATIEGVNSTGGRHE